MADFPFSNIRAIASRESFAPGDIREIGDDSTRRSMTDAPRGKVNSFIQKTVENSRIALAAASRGFRDFSNFPSNDFSSKNTILLRSSRRTGSRAAEIFMHDHVLYILLGYAFER